MFDGPKIAKAYEALKHSPHDANVITAYAQFAREIENQFDVLPVRVDFTAGDDPYLTSADMFNDVANNRRLKIFSGGTPHELMPKHINLKFRAVHDYFGHFVGRNNFGWAGECRAYLQHSKMFSRLANRALYTETIAQNSWFNFSEQNAGKPNSLREFPEQKAGLLII